MAWHGIILVESPFLGALCYLPSQPHHHSVDPQPQTHHPPPLQRNYLDVYRYESWGSHTLPPFHLHQTFLPSDLLLHASHTQPPPLLAEADLLSLMDKVGLRVGLGLRVKDCGVVGGCYL